MVGFLARYMMDKYKINPADLAIKSACGNAAWASMAYDGFDVELGTVQEVMEEYINEI